MFQRSTSLKSNGAGVQELQPLQQCAMTPSQALRMGPGHSPRLASQVDMRERPL